MKVAILFDNEVIKEVDIQISQADCVKLDDALDKTIMHIADKFPGSTVKTISDNLLEISPIEEI